MSSHPFPVLADRLEPDASQADTAQPHAARPGTLRRSPSWRLAFGGRWGWCGGLTGVGSLVLAISVVTGQPPEPAPALPLQQLELPTPAAGEDDDGLQQVVIPLSDVVRRRIEEALNQPTKDDQGRPLPPASTGDPILDDVLEVIRRRGSVVEGSMLDPRNEASALGTPPTEDRVPPVPPRPYDAVPYADELNQPPRRTAVPAGSGYVGGGPDARFAAAEALLKAARKLSEVPGGDDATDRLIATMRERATMLLIDQYSPNPADYSPADFGSDSFE